MKISVEFAKDIAKGKDVDDEEEVPQEWALGHTRSDSGRLGYERFKLNEQGTAWDIELKPVYWGVSDANGG